MPAGAVAGGVDVDGDEEDVSGALGCADGVGAADAFFEGDVFGFGDEELGVVAFALKGCEDLVGRITEMRYFLFILVPINVFILEVRLSIGLMYIH